MNPDYFLISYFSVPYFSFYPWTLQGTILRPPDYESCDYCIHMVPYVLKPLLGLNFNFYVTILIHKKSIFLCKFCANFSYL
jgi:hypothetical protein